VLSESSFRVIELAYSRKNPLPRQIKLDTPKENVTLEAKQPLKMGSKLSKMAKHVGYTMDKQQ
jgi:hypothetical protein